MVFRVFPVYISAPAKITRQNIIKNIAVNSTTTNELTSIDEIFANSPTHNIYVTPDGYNLNISKEYIDSEKIQIARLSTLDSDVYHSWNDMFKMYGVDNSESCLIRIRQTDDIEDNMQLCRYIYAKALVYEQYRLSQVLNRIIDGFQSRFFMTGYGALKIDVTYNNGAFSQLNWFKAMVMFDFDYVVEYLLKTPDSLRHHEANRLVKMLPAYEAKRFITMFISKIKDSTIEVSLSKLIIELSKNEKFISDKKGIITWFGRIVFLLYRCKNKDFLRQEYIDKLKSILKRTGIKK